MTISRIANPRLLAAGLCAATIILAGCSGSSVGPTVSPNAPAPAPAGMSQTMAQDAFESNVNTLATTAFTFTTLDDQSDPTFNQLLGINVNGEISGYFGSGAAGHPNKGYTLVPPYGQTNYTNENFPGSMQTQVTGLNSKGYTCGFWINSKGVNRGFIEWAGIFTSYRDPNTGTGTVNQILGLNDAGLAVGFYTDGKGKNHAFKIRQGTTTYVPIVPPGGNNATASAVNGNGVITGFYTVGGTTVGFIDNGGSFSSFSFPGATSTMPFGINLHNTIVGGYTDSGGKSHGFILRTPFTHATYQSIDDPNGVGTTTVNGVNNHLDLVGFYVDAAGNTDGMLAKP